MRSTDAPRRAGFILPTTLLVMTLLTVMLTAAFILASAEFRATDNSLANNRALSLAQAGLENYFSLQRNLDTASTYDSIRITLTRGYADVVGRRVRAQNGTRLPLWMVRAIGNSSDPAQPGQVQGQRAVAQLAELNNGLIPSRAAITAVNGVIMYSATATVIIKGGNFGFSLAGCTIPSGSAADTAAVATPTGGYNNNGAVDATHPLPSGTRQSLGSAASAYDSSHVDWSRVLSGDFSPDFVGSLPPVCSGSCTYNSYYMVGNVTIPGGTPSSTQNRRALLVATGDVTFTTHVHWDGIIIAGGRLLMTSTGDTLHGMAITGLNCGTGSCPATADSIQRAASNVAQWDWCYTHAAIGGLNGLVPMKNTWNDTWSLY